jgi:hypothetical protein
MLKVAEKWLLSSDAQAVAGISIKEGALFLQRLANLDKLHVMEGEVKGKWDAGLTQLLLLLCTSPDVSQVGSRGPVAVCVVSWIGRGAAVRLLPCSAVVPPHVPPPAHAELCIQMLHFCQCYCSGSTPHLLTTC